MSTPAAIVAVSGANGFVGWRVCEVLAEAGTDVRAIVRRPGTAPRLPHVTELVGDITDPQIGAAAVSGAAAVITTVHPMDSDRATQERVGVHGTVGLARAAAAAEVERFIHVSTAGVYDRSPAVGDVDESSALVGDDADDYAVTKRDADLALGDLNGITRVLLRPPAILGPGPTSTWNTLVPEQMRTDPRARRAVPERTFAWVHVSDLAALAADLALGVIPDSPEPADGPLAGGCTAVNVAAERATQRDYVGTVTAALEVGAEWETGPAWTGRILPDRARSWGWHPRVDLPQALGELRAGLEPA